MIVLLILAVVTINVIRNDGIINYAKNVRTGYEESVKEENQVFKNYISKIEENKTPDSVKVDVSNYGSIVEYSKDLNGNGNYVDDWKIFYADGDKVYIIASNIITTKPNGIWEENKNSAYGFNFKTVTPADISSEVAEKYKLSWRNTYITSLNNSNIYNGRAIGDLLDVDVWTETLGNREKGIEAIGSPTLEMWVASWNEMEKIHGTNKYAKLYTNTNSMGYYVGNQENTTSYSYDLRDTVGHNNELYFPKQSNKSGYWLASPSTYISLGGSSTMGPLHVMRVECNGNVSYDSFMSDSNGMRPVVAIPTELLIKNADGILKVNV